MTLAIAVIFALVISVWFTRRICDPTSALHVLDHPNQRSLHTHPVPRTGGVAILAGVFAGLLVLALAGGPVSRLFWLALAMLLIAVLSFVDDRRGLSVRVRLLGHLTSGVLLVAGGLYLSEPVFPGTGWTWPVGVGVVFSVLYLVWMVNLYNFMDGMDGFAGGMAVIGFGSFALLGGVAGNSPFLAVNLIVAASVAGFLVFNFPPARIFMGDTGSAVLGLLAGGLSLWGASSGVFPFWVALLVFSPFIVDATVTLLRRLWRRERVWQAHKTHYYQRLVQLGWGHRKTVLWEYALMLACAGSAVWAVTSSARVQFAILGFWVVAYVLLAGSVHVLERRRTAGTPPPSRPSI
jgi:UDP-N-acetylmuramyl pentapeptide phosphotransferase/UDP-N-acetylglucosamine-1-phosphate transferase